MKFFTILLIGILFVNLQLLPGSNIHILYRGNLKKCINMIRMRILKVATALAVLITAAACDGHSARATEKSDNDTPVLMKAAETPGSPRHAATAGPASHSEMPEAPHDLGVPEEELQRVIGDGSAKAELDFMEAMVRKVEELDSRKASLHELREPVNNASYSARRLDRINKTVPLTDAEIRRGQALMERLNVVMTRRVPNMVTIGDQ